jgi:hypothetical protein
MHDGAKFSGLDWFNAQLLAQVPGQIRQNREIYLWWNVWKKRNRRTFQQKSLTPDQVAHLCKDDIHQFEHATTLARREG